VISGKEVLAENNGNLSVQLYVTQSSNEQDHETVDLVALLKTKQYDINNSMEDLFAQLKDLGILK
jgi:hypothetical protein